MNIAPFEVNGLFRGTEGRCCAMHPVCGLSVAVGDVVFVKSERLVIDGQLEEVGAVYRVVDRMVACKIGFMPLVLSYSGRLDELRKQYAEVVELYGLSSNEFKTQKNQQLFGVAACMPVNLATEV